MIEKWCKNTWGGFNLLVSEIIKAVPCIKSSIVNDIEINGAFLDSRLVRENSLFFASKGENVDGNLYAESAINKGAAAVIMDNEKEYEKINGNKILVKDTLEYMQVLGRYNFERVHKKNVRIIAVTGSFGKTGMKEMLKYIFEENEKVYATEGNKNNMLGVLLTGCGIDDNASTIIIELGSNNFGEIKELTEIVRPNMAIVTNVGHAHIGRFKTFERLIFEKMSISDGLVAGGEFIIPTKLTPFVPKGDFKFRTFGESAHSGIRITEYKHNGEYITFKTNITKSEFRLNHPYLHVAENSLCAIYAALLCNISEERIASGLLNYKAAKGHGSIEKIGDIFLIDDSYNAGFESFIKSTESLNLINISPKYAIYGEMGEIEGFEEAFYNEITQLAYTYKDITFFLVGENYQKASNLENRIIFATKEECIKKVKEINCGAIVVKASRAKKFEDIVNAIKEK